MFFNLSFYFSAVYSNIFFSFTYGALKNTSSFVWNDWNDFWGTLTPAWGVLAGTAYLNLSRRYLIETDRFWLIPRPQCPSLQVVPFCLPRGSGLSQWIKEWGYFSSCMCAFVHVTHHLSHSRHSFCPTCHPGRKGDSIRQTDAITLTQSPLNLNCVKEQT